MVNWWWIDINISGHFFWKNSSETMGWLWMYFSFYYSLLLSVKLCWPYRRPELPSRTCACGEQPQGCNSRFSWIVPVVFWQKKNMIYFCCFVITSWAKQLVYIFNYWTYSKIQEAFSVFVWQRALSVKNYGCCLAKHKLCLYYLFNRISD